MISIRPGDILATSGRSFDSRAIRLATCSRWSHVAIAAWVTRADLERHWPELDWDRWTPQTLIFESTTGSDLPCKILGFRTAGVQAHSIGPWIKAYPGRVYRLPLATLLVGAESERLTEHLLTLLRKGTPYDIGGALLAGTRLVKWLPCAARWVDDRRSRFCVEMVEPALSAAFVSRTLPPLDPSRDRPRDLVRKASRSTLWGKPRRIK